jgi:hypothetical protein
MERVAFLVEQTGEQIGALLNPETVVMTRAAGVEARTSTSGRLTGAGLTDDPLLFTGGGRTELRLELLFDVELAPADAGVSDVRQLTRPIWALAENSASDRQRRRPPAVRFVWGRAWNIPGVVTEVAERFDRFAADGSPLRSWMRLVFVRIGSAADEPGGEAWELATRLPRVDLTAEPVGALAVPGGTGRTTGAVGTGTIGAAGTDTGGAGQPAPPRPTDPVELGMLSLAAFGTPLLWKALLAYNDVDDPVELARTMAERGGAALAVPPLGESPR